MSEEKERTVVVTLRIPFSWYTEWKESKLKLVDWLKHQLSDTVSAEES